jgi:nitrate/nitrite transporter NarK
MRLQRGPHAVAEERDDVARHRGAKRGMAGAAGGILIAQATGWTLELTGSYWPILIYAGLAYLIAFTAIHLLVPKMEPAPVAAGG